MKSIPYLSDKAKDLIQQAFDRKIVSYFNNLDNYVDLLVRCSYSFPDKRDVKEYLHSNHSKTTNPVKERILALDRFFSVRGDNALYMSRFCAIAANMGIALPNNFSTLDNEQRWNVLMNMDHNMHDKLISPSATHYINESLGALDIQKGYFSFHFKAKKNVYKELLVPIDLYCSTDIRQTNLTALYLLPVKRINIFEIILFVRNNKESIIRQFDNSHSNVYSIQNISTLEQQTASLKKIKRTDFINMLYPGASIKNSSQATFTPTDYKVVDLDINRMKGIHTRVASTKAHNSQKPESPISNVPYRGKADPGTITYSRRRIIERNDDD